MNLDDVFAACALMQAVDILRNDNDRPLVVRLGKRGDRMMSSIGLGSGHKSSKLTMRSKTALGIALYGCGRGP